MAHPLMLTHAPEFTTTHELKEGYLFFRSVGTTATSLQESLRYIEDLLEVTALHGHPPVLVDRREVQRHPQSPVTSDHFLEQAPALLIQHGYTRDTQPPGQRIAVLVRPEHLPFVFLQESAFHSRGVNIRFFAEESHALQWLLPPA